MNTDDQDRNPEASAAQWWFLPGQTTTIFILPNGRYTRRAKAHPSWQPY